MRVIISAGGTGGHIFPAIAVADTLKKLAPETDILFVGADGKMEMERVPKAGYAIEGLWIAGLQRQLTWRNLWLNVQLPFKVLSSLLKVRRIIQTFQPDIAVGFGGFASGPTLKAAAAQGIPTVLQEQNSYAGITNKLLAQKAAAICVAYDGLDRFFPADKLHLTGNPVRADITDVSAKKAEGLAYFGLDPNKKTIAILGGSLGAKSMNMAVESSAQLLENQDNIQILWQCGRLYEVDFKQGKAAQLPHVHMRAFIDRMDLAYAAADVVVARAGALTISELCLAGLPAVLVPSPNVAEDHQTKNALALVEKEAAVLVKDIEASTEMMATALKVVADTDLQNRLSTHIRALGRPDAAERIARLILKLGKRK